MSINENKVYRLTLNSDHPMVRDHQVYGQPILPGLAYIDLIYQTGAKIPGLTYDDYALSDLTIERPLVVNSVEGVALCCAFTPTESGWRVAVTGAAACGGDSFCYARAGLTRSKTLPDERIDISQMKVAEVHEMGFEQVYASFRSRGLTHLGDVKAQGRLLMSKTQCLVHIIPPPAGTPGADYLFHPAIVDSAALAASCFATWSGYSDEDALWLPLHYGHFRARRRLDAECYAQINLDSIRMKKEISYFDVDFFDPEGFHLATLQGMASKRVRDQAHIVAPPTEAVASGAEETSTIAPARMRIRQIFTQITGRDISAEFAATPFFDLGINSAQLIALVNDLGRILGRTLSPTTLFEYSNLQELETFLLQEPPVDAVPLADKCYTFYAQEAFLQDHRVAGVPALMGVTHPCLIADSLIRAHPGGYPVMLENVIFSGGPIALSEGGRVELTVSFDAEKAGIEGRVTAKMATDEAERRYCSAQVRLKASGTDATPLDIAALCASASQVEDKALERLWNTTRSFTLGPMLRTLAAAWIYDADTTLYHIELGGKRAKGDNLELTLDPLALAACFSLPPDRETMTAEDGAAYIPLLMEKMVIHRPMPDTVYIVKTTRSKKAGFYAFDAGIFSADGTPIAELVNASMREVSEARLSDAVKTERSDGAVPGIAIVGLAGRYPGAGDVETFWNNLKLGVDCISEIPVRRWNWRDYYTEDRARPGFSYGKWGGFIDDVDKFDPLFFNIAPREAGLIDPQERLFLECAWHALEDAGYTRASLKGQEVGVFVGAMPSDYPLCAAPAATPEARLGIGGGTSSIATRIAYFCDFSGPCMTVDTMCSSSITALYLACQAIESGRVDVALAGGVNLTLHPNKYLMLSQSQFLSSKGRCESFAEGGDGYVPGEGVGAILIKPLALAERDGDHIYGVIKGIEINHGGRAMGYTAPNPGAQRRLIERVLKKANVSARRIGYVEAHGTGTALGDPIEVEALSAAYSSESDETQFCQLGSVKSHVGHLEAAAGICAITKVLMQLKHRQIAPGLHAEALNAGIAFQQTPFEVTRTLREWPSPPGEARVCAVSSFGAGGANGHLIVEEYVTSHPRDVVPGRVAVVLSAQGNTQLQTQARNLLRMIETQPPETYDLASLAYTLQVGREAMSVRLALLADSPQRLAAGLKRFLKDPDDTGDDIFFGQVKDAEPQFCDDAALTQAMKTSDYASLLAQWVRGVNVAWEKGYQQNVPQRMSLPTYPFLRESYWLPGADTAPSVAPCPQEDKASVSDDPVLGILQRLAEGQLPPAEAARAFTLCTSAHTRRSLVFMFAGVGDCYPNMSRGLYETQEVFRREMDLCFMLLKEGYNLDLKDLLYPGEPPVIKPETALNLRKMLTGTPQGDGLEPLYQARYGHTALFCIEFAQAKCLMEKGWPPTAMIGSSLGEYVAACLAGVMSLKAALDMVVERAIVLESMEPGGMLVVALSEAELRPWLDAECFLALKNTPQLSVVSGEKRAINRLEQILTQRDVACRRIANPYPLHSPLMRSAAEELNKIFSRVVLKAPHIPYISNVSGGWIDEREVRKAGYWLRHACETVRFSEGVETLLREGEREFIEIGFGNGLGSFVMQHTDAVDARIYQTLPAQYEGVSDIELFSQLLQQLRDQPSPQEITFAAD